MNDQGIGLHADNDEIALSRTTTDPLPLNLGDRIAIERRVDKLESKVDQHIVERDKQAEAFFVNRMLPLEKSVSSKARVLWFTLGIAVAALLFSAATTAASVVMFRFFMSSLHGH